MQDSEAGAVPTPASVPAPSHVPTSGEATTSEHDIVWLNRYREMVQKEKDDASRTIFTRTARLVYAYITNLITSDTWVSANTILPLIDYNRSISL